MKQENATEYYAHPNYANYATSHIYDHGEEGRVQVIQFPDFETLMEFGENGAVNPESKDEKDWRYGEYKTPELTRQALITGTPIQSHMRMYDKAKQRISSFNIEDAQTSAVKQVRRRAFGEQGDELDIDRYMSGDVQCWQSKPAARKRTSIKVFLNLSVSQSMGAKTMMQNTALFASVLSLVEAQGMSSEILLGTIQRRIGGGYVNQYIAYFTEKQSFQYLDESKLLSRGAPGLYRWYFFNVIKNMQKGGPGFGYGAPSRGDDPLVNAEMVRLGVDLLVNGSNLQENANFFLKKISEIQYGNEQVL